MQMHPASSQPSLLQLRLFRLPLIVNKAFFKIADRCKKGNAKMKLTLPFAS